MPGVSTDDISTRLNVRGASGRYRVRRTAGPAWSCTSRTACATWTAPSASWTCSRWAACSCSSWGFPAEFGDATAGVFDMRTRTPPAEGTRNTVSSSLSSVSYNGQGTLADGRGQWLASLRRGFLEYVLAVQGGAGTRDLAHLLGRPGRGALAGQRPPLPESARVLWAGDVIAWRDEEGEGTLESGWTNGYGWLTWNGRLSDRPFVSTVPSRRDASSQRPEGRRGRAPTGALHTASGRLPRRSRGLRFRGRAPGLGGSVSPSDLLLRGRVGGPLDFRELRLPFPRDLYDVDGDRHIAGTPGVRGAGRLPRARRERDRECGPVAPWPRPGRRHLGGRKPPRPTHPVGRLAATSRPGSCCAGTRRRHHPAGQHRSLPHSVHRRCTSSAGPGGENRLQRPRSAPTRRP